MNKRLLFLFLSLPFILSYGCQKSNDSAKELLSVSGWKYVNFEKREVRSGVPKAWISYIATWDTCKKDNITLFKSDGAYEENEGATKCSIYLPQAFKTGSWSLLSNNTQLRVDELPEAPINIHFYDITILDKNTLQLQMQGGPISYPIGNVPPDYEELRWTYSH